jgi:glycosyltransferase involved in cell wall biosynthesis
MIRVAIDCHKLEDGSGASRAGIGRHTQRLLEELAEIPNIRQTHRFYLYFKAGIPEGMSFLEDELFVLKVAKLPFFFPFFRPSFNGFFHLGMPLRALLDRIDVGFFPSFMLPAFWPTRSVVVLTNDVHYEMTQGSLPLRYRIGYTLFSTWAARRATRITTQTNASADDISKQFNIRKADITVVPLGADIAAYGSDEAPKEDYVLYVGQAFPRRHLRETMLAFEMVAPEFPSLRLIAVGVDKYNPPMANELARAINSRLGGERVERREGVSDAQLRDLYRRATLFTYISSSEAMGLPPLEALAAGTVPIVADTPTTREIFGNHAFFVKNPDDPADIAITLKSALSNKESRERVLSGREEVIGAYTWARHAGMMLELFNETARA